MLFCPGAQVVMVRNIVRFLLYVKVIYPSRMAKHRFSFAYLVVKSNLLVFKHTDLSPAYVQHCF